jgi:uroporphyrinogen decarboxylase
MDRLLAAIRGEPSDRIPVFCNLIDQGSKELGIPLQRYYSNGEYVAEAQLKMLRKYGHDNVWSLFYVGKEAELLGCRKIQYSTDGPPNIEEYIIQSLDGIDKLSVPPDVLNHEQFAEVRKCLNILHKEVGTTHPICAYITSTMTLPALLMGMEKWLELLFFGPATARDMLLAKCHEFFIKEVAAYRNAGATVLVYSNPFGSTDTVPMKYFMEHSLPWIERDLQAVGTSGMVYYCGMARMNNVINTVLDRTGIGVFYISPLDDLNEARTIINNRVLTCGVINDIRLIDWTEAEVQREVHRILSIGMKTNKFLFGTGVMPLLIPDANIRAMLEAAFKYGVRGKSDLCYR